MQLPDAEEGNSTKDLDGNGRFLGQDHNIQPPSKRPAKGTEKEFEPPLANAGCDDSGLGESSMLLIFFNLWILHDILVVTAVVNYSRYSEK